MECFNITHKDVVEYMEDKSEYENKQALFIQYIRQYGINNKEGFNMLVLKYNIMTYPIEELKMIMNDFSNQADKSMNFKKYLEKINNQDFDAICNIVLILISNYECKKIDYYSLMELILCNLKIDISNVDKRLWDMLGNILETYKLVGQVHQDEYRELCIDIDYEQSKKMLKEYSNIYGIDVVNKIRDNIEELLKNKQLINRNVKK